MYIKHDKKVALIARTSEPLKILSAPVSLSVILSADIWSVIRCYYCPSVIQTAVEFPYKEWIMDDLRFYVLTVCLQRKHYRP